jgi:hypothetical protein
MYIENIKAQAAKATGQINIKLIQRQINAGKSPKAL